MHIQKGVILQIQSKVLDKQQLLGIFLTIAGLVTVVFTGISFKICIRNG
jgi:hypothetical protein